MSSVRAFSGLLGLGFLIACGDGATGPTDPTDPLGSPIMRTGAAATVYVEKSGRCDGLGPCYNSIQAGIDAAAGGWTVAVFAGHYYETLRIEKTLTLRAYGSVRPDIWIRSGSDAGVVIDASNVTLEGLFLMQDDAPVDSAIIQVLPDGSGNAQHQKIVIRDCIVEGGRRAGRIAASFVRIEHSEFRNQDEETFEFLALSGPNVIVDNAFHNEFVGGQGAVASFPVAAEGALSGFLTLLRNTAYQRGPLVSFDGWGGPETEFALTVQHNTVVETRGPAIEIRAATGSPESFQRLYLAVVNNIFQRVGAVDPSTGGDALYVDYTGGSSTPEDNPVALPERTLVQHNLSFEAARSTGSDNDPTGTYGYSTTREGSATPPGASLEMFDASDLFVADPRLADPREGDFSLLPGSPAVGAASDGTNLGAWQGENRSNRVFVTRTARTPDFGGLAGADRWCLEEADQAGLRGTWVGWLSDSTEDARDRITPGDFRLVDGTVVAGSLAELLGGTLRVPIGLSAAGDEVAARTWTATQADGTLERGGGTCGDWTNASAGDDSQGGRSTETNTLWTDEYLDPCNVEGHLYCFEVDPGLHKKVFVTERLYAPDLGGLPGADQICSDLASEHEIPGIFKAWLSTPEESAADRMTQATVRYLRLDGAIVAQDWDDLTDGELVLPIDVSETGSSIATEAWTGTAPDGTALSETCNSWSRSDPAGGRGAIGRTTQRDVAWTDHGSAPCEHEKALYCVEQ